MRAFEPASTDALISGWGSPSMATRNLVVCEKIGRYQRGLCLSFARGLALAETLSTMKRNHMLSLRSVGVGLAVAIFALAGCQKLTKSSSGVAVIDLDKVATAMGWMEEMTKSIQATDAELRNQLDEILKNTLRSIAETKKHAAALAKLPPEQ